MEKNEIRLEHRDPEPVEEPETRHFEESVGPMERRSEREEAPVWGMLPLFAIIGSLLLVLLALAPFGTGPLFFGIITAAVLIVGAILVIQHRQRMR